MTDKSDDSSRLAHNYTETIAELVPSAKELLVEYAGIPEAEALQHAHRVRDKAWEAAPYGCVGVFAFTWCRPTISRTETYQQVLSRVKAGDQLLDLGCGFGQNIRKVVHDGGPAENVTGADISQHLIDYGYEYFQDREKLATKFIVGDVLDETAPAYSAAKESFDIVFTSMFYHLWDWENQAKACIQTIKLLKPIPGSMIFGVQIGASPAAAVQRQLSSKRIANQKIMFQHDEQSWQKLWKEIEAVTGTKWDVQAKCVVTPEIEERRDVMPVTEGSTIHAIFFSMTRL